MVNLPLPMLTAALALAAAVVFLRLHLGNRLANGFFAAYFAASGVSSALVGLRFGYGIETLALLQSIVPFFIGPLLFLGFRAMTRPRPALLREAAFTLGFAALLCLATLGLTENRDAVDVALALSYLAYSAALLWLWSRGAETFTRVRLDLATTAHQWALWSAVLLLLFFIGDTTIAISFALERSERAVALISVGSLVLIVTLLATILVFARYRDRTAAAKPTAPVNDEHQTIEAAARDLLERSELFLDTELTVERLAKRLHLPARALSEAINAREGVNVSQYVNGFRLRRAAELLDTSTLSVTKIAEKSGFLTRSNFYREFQRAFDQSPATYRDRAKS